MEECKCGRIPPCYGGKKFHIHEELEKIMVGNETHDIVYELNKQMCDIGKAILTKKKDNMEEKKTKKMTRAEAFEYLKGKKVACDGSNNEAVQRKLFDIGIEWLNCSTSVIKEIYVVFLFIDLRGKITHCGGNRVYFYNHDYKEISADDILSIEIVEEKKEKSENINNDLDKWIEIVRNKYCRHGWSFVISESNYGLIKGDLIEEKSKR